MSTLPFLLVGLIWAVHGEIASENIILARIRPGANPTSVAYRFGLVHVQSLVNGEYHAFRKDRSARLDHALMQTDPDLIWYEQQEARQHVLRGVSGAVGPPRPPAGAAPPKYQFPDLSHLRPKRFTAHGLYSSNALHPLDPLYLHQWNLISENTNTMTLANVAADATWNRHESYCGERAPVIIVDNGVAYMHPDLASNYNASYSANFNGNGLPTPTPGQSHGTSVAGVAAAGINTDCGVGTCPMCQFGAVKLIAGPSTDYTESQAMNIRPSSAAVYQNSWGPPDDGQTMTGPGIVTKATIARNAVQGRGGLGSLYVWAAGNGAMNGDNANYDGYANSRFVLAVGAVDFTGRRASYSEPCACLAVTAPSSGAADRGLVAPAQYANSSMGCTTSFGGTSGAAPAVSGAVALLLGKFPGLSRRDILTLLATSSARIDPSNPDWTTRNARGVAHSHNYGWGLLNMYELTRLAILWVTLPNEFACDTGPVTLNRLLPDGSSAYSWQADMPTLFCLGNPSAAAIDYVESVELSVQVSHPSRGDLSILLADPLGVTSVLASPHNDTKV